MLSTPESQKVEERRAIVVIGMISSGKSTFLNSLLGITYLESKDDVTTKFVTIIRYNEKLKEPKLYHLKLIKEENLKEKNPKENENTISQNNNLSENTAEKEEDNSYYFVKDGEESIGKENIIERIKKINKEEKKEGKNNSSNSRSESTEESNEDMRYIKGIFQYIKKKVEREIIIFSSETYYKPQNLQIIKDIQKEINVVLYNNLIILNKIDICEDREKTIDECKQFFVNNLDSDIFNIYQNTFAPLNSMQFKNEILMRDNFENYYLYYLNKYIEKYIRIKEEEAKKIKIIPFVEFIANEITTGKKSNEKKEFINDLVINFDDDKLGLIKDVYEKVKKNLNYIIDYGINFEADEDDDEDQSLLIIKAFYQNFEDKVNIPKYSDEVQLILDYFNKFTENSTNMETAPLPGTLKTPSEVIIDESKALLILKDIFNKLKKYTKENDKDNIINILSDNLIMMEKFIYNHRKIYIPFIGVSSAGKSTILNCIVGYKLFPEAQNECTTRGIIIEYSDSDTIELYETTIDSERNYYIFSPKKKVADGYKDVRSYLKSLNYRYSKDESKHFYIVKTTIQCFDDFKFSDELKQRILLVDLPGSDTKDNQFNQVDDNKKSVYEKLLSISSSFIYINKGRAITETGNQTILKKLYTQIKDSSKLGNNDYLKACLFSINLFNKVTEEELDEVKIKQDLSKILFDDTGKYEQINSVFFNAKNFYDYLYYSTLLKEHEATIDKLEEKYRIADDSSFLRSSNFPKFVLKQLKQKIKDFGLSYQESTDCSPEFLETIEKIITSKMKLLNEKLTNNDKKTIKQIANIFNWLKNEQIYKEMDAYKNSYCHQFLNILKQQIELSKRYKDEEYIKKLKESLKYFDTFFSKDVKGDKIESDTKKEFNEKKEELNKKLENNFDNFTLKDLFETTKKQLDDKIMVYKKNISKMIKDGKNSEEIIKFINTGINKILDSFRENLDERTKQFDQFIQNLIKDIKELHNFFNQNELQNNSQYKNNFNQLLNAGNININMQKEEKEGSILDSITKTLSLFWNSIKSIFNIFNIFKGKEESIIEKIDEIKNEIIGNLNNKERIMNLNLNEEIAKIKENFTAILALAFTDLSNIEEKKWNESKELYNKAKKFLLPEENNTDNA